MAEPAKFLFERSFEQPQESVSVEQRLRADFDVELAAARQDAVEEGRAEGRSAAMNELEARIADTLGTILARADAMSQEMHRAQHEIRATAIETALAAAEALAPELIRSQPLASLEALFIECLEFADHPPHIAIRVNDGIVEDLQVRVTRLARDRGFAGEIVLIGDPEIRLGDTRIEWADGGIGRDFEATRESIAETVRRHLEGQKALLSGPGPAATAIE